MDTSQMTGADLRYRLDTIKAKMTLWEITIEQAKLDVVPYLDEVNKRWKQIAKKFGKKFYPITFTNIAR